MFLPVFEGGWKTGRGIMMMTMPCFIDARTQTTSVLDFSCTFLSLCVLSYPRSFPCVVSELESPEEEQRWIWSGSYKDLFMMNEDFEWKILVTVVMVDSFFVEWRLRRIFIHQIVPKIGQNNQNQNSGKADNFEWTYWKLNTMLWNITRSNQMFEKNRPKLQSIRWFFNVFDQILHQIQNIFKYRFLTYDQQQVTTGRFSMVLA